MTIDRARLIRYAGASERLQPHPLERVDGRSGRPAGHPRARHVEHGAGRPDRHRLGQGPGRGQEFGTRFTRPVYVPDDAVGATVEFTGVVAALDPDARTARVDRHRQVQRTDDPRRREGAGPAQLTLDRRRFSPGGGQEFGHPVHAGDQVVVAQRIGQPEVAGRAERLAGHHRDLRLVQHQRGQLAGRRRPNPVERLADQLRSPTGTRRTRPPGVGQLTPGMASSSSTILPPAAVERRPHVGDRVQRPGDRGQRRLLGDVADVRGQVGLQVRRGLDDVLRADHPADPPAGHRVRLGHTVDHDAAVGDLRRDHRHRDVHARRRRPGARRSRR